MSQLKETADPLSPFGSADSGVRVPPLSSKAKRRHMSQLEETADPVSPFGSADSGVRVPSLPTKAKRSRTSPNSKSPPPSIESSFHSFATIAKKASRSVFSRLDPPSRSADSRRRIPGHTAPQICPQRLLLTTIPRRQPRSALSSFSGRPRRTSPKITTVPFPSSRPRRFAPRLAQDYAVLSRSPTSATTDCSYLSGSTCS